MNHGEEPKPRILTRPEHCLSRKNIDPDARKVMVRLNRNGFKAVLVGGSVRDLLLNKKPKDFDVGTDARPGQVKKLFRNCRIIGKRFRLAHIYFRDNKVIEVSTFRKKPPESLPDDAEEAVSGKPGDNTFGTPHEDALRRDLTINGLFYDIENFSIIDYVGGVEDLRDGIVRTIGDPVERFREDPLRMIRAVRHAVQAGFRIEPVTYAAILACAHLLTESNPARLQDDVQKDLDRGHFASVLRTQMETGILAAYFPELDAYLRTAGTPDALFQPAWVWEALARLDADAGCQPHSRRFRMASLLLPLLERRLLDSFGVPPSPVRNLKETHGYLIECCTPMGFQRSHREEVKTLWFAWLRLRACLSEGKVPFRFQNKPYFSDACAWHTFYRSPVPGEAEGDLDAAIQQAVQAGMVAGQRRKKRRRRTPRKHRTAEPGQGSRDGCL